MRKTLLIPLVLVAVLAVASAAPGKGGKGHGKPHAYPATIALPNGFQPEGLATHGSTFYAGSIPTGAIYRGSLETGQGSLLVPAQANRAALGLAADHGRLFVAGGPTGKAFVYDAKTGADLGTFQLAQVANALVNDVVVTKTAAWFTDSFNPVLYKLPLGPGHSLPTQAQVQTVSLTGDLHYGPGFNANGIEATRDGKTLVTVQSNTGLLFTIDPSTGVTRTIAGVSVPNGDGILLHGKRLYVVRNFDNLIAVVRLRGDLSSGSVQRLIGSTNFDVPTSIDRKGHRLYVVNARFTTTATPTTTYSVVGVPAK